MADDGSPRRCRFATPADATCSTSAAGFRPGARPARAGDRSATTTATSTRRPTHPSKHEYRHLSSRSPDPSIARRRRWPLHRRRPASVENYAAWENKGRGTIRTPANLVSRSGVGPDRPGRPNRAHRLIVANCSSVAVSTYTARLVSTSDTKKAPLPEVAGPAAGAPILAHARQSDTSIRMP